MKLPCCPICGENVSENVIHFYKHLKYRQYYCNEKECEKEFYSEEDLSKHAELTGHRKSFQRAVNSYMDFIIESMKKDSVFAANLSTEDLVKIRYQHLEAGDKKLNNLMNGDEDKESSQTSNSSSSKSKRKSRDQFEYQTEPLKKKTQSIDGKRKRNSDKIQIATANSTLEEIDLTDELATTSKRRKTTSLQGTNVTGSNCTVPEITNWLSQWGNNPLNSAQITCSLCKKEVNYDYLIRKDHVGREHMPADAAPDDFDDILKTMIDFSFPGLANTDLACQVCMIPKDIPTKKRREHIENVHFKNLPILLCPVNNCHTEFGRQCRLSDHMKTIHGEEMSRFKNKDFQSIRIKRNSLISLITNTCFPTSQFEGLVKRHSKSLNVTKNSSSPLTTTTTATAETTRVIIPNDILLPKVKQWARENSRTRRASHYNTTENDSSSSDEDGTRTRTSSLPVSNGDFENNEETELCEDDIIFIRETVNTEMLNNLRRIIIKEEPVETIEIVESDEDSKIEQIEQIENEIVKNEEAEQGEQINEFVTTPVTSFDNEYVTTPVTSFDNEYRRRSYESNARQRFPTPFNRQESRRQFSYEERSRSDRVRRNRNDSFHRGYPSSRDRNRNSRRNRNKTQNQSNSYNRSENVQSYNRSRNNRSWSTSARFE